MTDRSLPVSGSVTFEELKKTNEHGAEFWSARELQQIQALVTIMSRNSE